MIIETDDAPATVTGVSGLIDVHARFPARAYRGAVERAGVDGGALPAWDAEQTLDLMGDVGIEYAVLSPPPPPEFADLDDARRTAREFNEELADQIADDPQTYGGVAFLPLPHVDAALEELAYALDVLKLDGAHLFTSYRGRYPGHPAFAPVLEELDRRRTAVVVHPVCPADAVGAQGPSPPVSELVLETLRAASDLLRSGALGRHPGIRWVLAHGGAAVLRAADDRVRGLYVDVLGTVDEPMLSRLVALQGPEKLLFGSEIPAACPTRVARGITTLMANAAVGDDVRHAVARHNALNLFPSVARKLRRPAP